MAFVLSLPSQSPLKRSFSESPCLRNGSPCDDFNSSEAIHHIALRNVSSPSFLSASSLPIQFQNTYGENLPPGNYHSCLGADPITGCGPKVVISVSEGHPSIEISSQDIDDTPINFTEPKDASSVVSIPEDVQSVSDVDDSPASQPFRRWMSTLRKRRIRRNRPADINTSRISTESQRGGLIVPLRHTESNGSPRRPTSITSSLGFVTDIKSASITLASTTLASASRRYHGRRSHHVLGSGDSGTRFSMDSVRSPAGPIMDEEAWLRSLKRRKILEELISSEEGYITDLKALSDIYLTLLASVPSISAVSRASIRQNLSQILHIHEDLLKELHEVVPHADRSTVVSPRIPPPTARSHHHRWKSADISTPLDRIAKDRRVNRHSLDGPPAQSRSSYGLLAETETSAAVARVFNSYMRHFFVYEEYGAQYEAMCHDLSATYRVVPSFSQYERGVEALSSSVVSMNNRLSGGKKGLTFADLLIKPIQRVCKYPLLFEDLRKQTPVCDDPGAHAELDKVLLRIQEALREIDKATVDPKTRKLVETTWLLQDRLTFDQAISLPTTSLRLFGHVILCGVLHVAYQTSERVSGQYMVCVMYKSHLVLATPGKNMNNHNIVAVITLADASVVAADNGRGLQCYTAPFTFKLLFESCRRIYEVILSACSEREEQQWRYHLTDRSTIEHGNQSDAAPFSQELSCSLALNIKPLRSVFGHAESLARRMSIHRAATLAQKTSTTQVIIKNTHTQRSSDDPHSTTSIPVGRSQSHLSSANVPTLAPRRADRVRLENVLADVWTREPLPYPGMPVGRAENPIRASANSVMRKLSMASLASNFSRRSSSYATIANSRSTLTPTSEVSLSGSSSRPSMDRVHQTLHRTRRPKPARRARPPPLLVDFHNAPTAFLPADFELKPTPKTRQRRRGNRSHTMTDASKQWNPQLSPKELAPPKMARNALTPPLTRTRASTPAGLRSRDSHLPFAEDTKRTFSLMSTGFAAFVPVRSSSNATCSPVSPGGRVATPQVTPSTTDPPMSQASASHPSPDTGENSPRPTDSETFPNSKKTLRSRTKLFKFWS